MVAIAFGFFLSPAVTLFAQDQPGFDELVSQASNARTANDVPRAIQLYQQAVQLNPQWGDGWWYLGLLEYQSSAYVAAQESLTHYLKLSHGAAPAVALRGLCEFETGDYEQSLADIEAGLSSGAANDPRNEQILRYHAGLLLTRAGQFQEAIQQYTWFADKGISSPELFLALGLAGLRTAKMPQDVMPDDHDLFTEAGSAAYEFLAHHQDKAQQDFQDLFRRFPKTANAHYLYGYLLMQADPDRAIEEFGRELEISPSNADADVMLAWNYLLQENPSQALPFAQKAFASGPSLPVALLVLGRSLLGTGELSKGTEYLEKAAQLDPKNLEVHIALAHAYSEQGRAQDARRERILSLRLENQGTGEIANP